MSKKCKAYSVSKLGLESADNRKAFYAGWDAALADIGNPITEQLAIPTVITCPFCSSEHVPGWLHDYNIDRGAHEEQPAIKQDLTPEQNQCKFPLCQSEDYQQALAEQIKQELYTGETAQCKPLTDEQIKTMWRCSKIYGTNQEKALALARAIEAAHGIKGDRK